MIDSSLTISIITLNVEIIYFGYSPIIRYMVYKYFLLPHGLHFHFADCFQETHFKYKDINTCNGKGWRNIYHADTSEKKAGMAMLISDKVDFRTKDITWVICICISISNLHL